MLKNRWKQRIFRKQLISSHQTVLCCFAFALRSFKGKIKGKNHQNFSFLNLGNELLQCEFTNELRTYREDIQIVCNHIAVENQTYFLFCRSQNIPCYVVDGYSYSDRTDCHTWNRVYFDDIWWNVDVTSYIASTDAGKELYGFCKLGSAYSLDTDYCITKIYWTQ